MSGTADSRKALGRTEELCGTLRLVGGWLSRLRQRGRQRSTRGGGRAQHAASNWHVWGVTGVRGSGSWPARRSAATPQQIYRDYADNGRLDQKYSQADLQRALRDVALQGYPRVGVQGAVEQALGTAGASRPAAASVHGPRPRADGCRRRAAAGRGHRAPEARQGQEQLAQSAEPDWTARDGDATVDERSRRFRRSRPFELELLRAGARVSACAAVSGHAARCCSTRVDARRGRRRGAARRRRRRDRARSPVPWLVALRALVVLGLLHLRGDVRLAPAPLGARRRARRARGHGARVDGRPQSPRSSSPGTWTTSRRRRCGCWAFSAFYLAAGRVALDWVAAARPAAHGELARPTLIVGAGRIGRLDREAARSSTPSSASSRSASSTRSRSTSRDLPLPVLGASWDLERLIEQHGIEHVVVTFSTAPSEVLLREIERCEELGVARLARAAPVRARRPSG